MILFTEEKNKELILLIKIEDGLYTYESFVVNDLLKECRKEGKTPQGV